MGPSVAGGSGLVALCGGSGPVALCKGLRKSLLPPSLPPSEGESMPFHGGKKTPHHSPRAKRFHTTCYPCQDPERPKLLSSNPEVRQARAEVLYNLQTFRDCLHCEMKDRRVLQRDPCEYVRWKTSLWKFEAIYSLTKDGGSPSLAAHTYPANGRPTPCSVPLGHQPPRVIAA